MSNGLGGDCDAIMGKDSDLAFSRWMRRLDNRILYTRYPLLQF